MEKIQQSVSLFTWQNKWPAKMLRILVKMVIHTIDTKALITWWFRNMSVL